MEVINKKSMFKPYTKINNKYVKIMWDYEPLTQINAKGEEIETPFAKWQTHLFKYIPNLSEIKDIITDYYNKKIQKEIISGFEWNGMKVWLSTENQLNYKTAYDLALQSNGSNLPIKFKFGDIENEIFYEFHDVENLKNFYLSAINHIKNTIENGWDKKNKINWNVFDK